MSKLKAFLIPVSVNSEKIENYHLQKLQVKFFQATGWVNKGRGYLGWNGWIIL